MTLSEIVIEGTLKPDGTLELDQRPNLSPGRVTVVVRQRAEATPPQCLDASFFQMMQEIWAGQRSRGHVPRSVEEVETQRGELRHEWEADVDAALRLQEESRRLRREADKRKQAQ